MLFETHYANSAQAVEHVPTFAAVIDPKAYDYNLLLHYMHHVREYKGELQLCKRSISAARTTA